MDGGNLAVDGEPTAVQAPRTDWASLLVGQVEQGGREGEEGQGASQTAGG